MNINANELPAYIFDYQRIAAKLQDKTVKDITVRELEPLVKLWFVEIVRELQESPEELEKLFLSKKEVAHVCGVSLATVNNWLQRGQIQGFKVGHRRLFDKSEIVNFIKKEIS